MSDKKIRIAIDGPAAAGKSTVAKKIADHLSIIYIDTGAMYRALTFQAIQNNVDVEDEDALIALLTNIQIQLKQSESGQLVFINGTNVTSEIRTKEVTNAVPIVAKHRLVRHEMVEMQRNLATDSNVVMDGRDIGTHVLPDAEVKVFLIASVDERAKRRHEENIKKRLSSNLETLKHEIKKRDLNDSKQIGRAQRLNSSHVAISYAVFCL